MRALVDPSRAFPRESRLRIRSALGYFETSAIPGSATPATGAKQEIILSANRFKPIGRKRKSVGKKQAIIFIVVKTMKLESFLKRRGLVSVVNGSFKKISAVFVLVSFALAGCLNDAGQENAYYGCTADAKICPGGSAVGRVPPDCEFEACPSGGSSPMPAPTVDNTMPPMPPGDISEPGAGSEDSDIPPLPQGEEKG